MVDFKKEVDKIKEEIIHTTSEVVRIPSVTNMDDVKDNAPFGTDMRKALDYMLALGKKDGFAVLDVDGYAGHIEYGHGEEVVGVLGHLDVVPVNDGWERDPFSGEVDDVNIYGRGASDDKGPTVAAYYAIKLIRDLGLPVSKRVRLIMGCDEESGSRCMSHYFSKQPYPNCGFTPDASFPGIYGEKGLCHYKVFGEAKNDFIKEFIAGTRPNVVPGFASALVIGNISDYSDFQEYTHKLQLNGKVNQEGDYVRLELEGVSAHGSMPELGKNAIVLLNEYLRTKTNNPLVKLIADYFYDDCYGARMGINHLGEMGPLTCNFGTLTWKDDKFEFWVDIRFPHDNDVEDMKKRITATMTSCGFDIQLGVGKPLYVDPQSEFVKTLVNAYAMHSGDIVSKPFAIGGGTYAKSMPNCIAFGMDFPNGPDMHIHGNNEFLPINDLLLGAVIFAQAIYDLIK